MISANLSVNLLTLTMSCLDIASLHPIKDGCVVVDIGRKSRDVPVSCESVYKTCNGLFLKAFKVMCAGKHCKDKV